MGLERNAPCPCGSGVKRKKCCGTDIEDGYPPELLRMMRVFYDLRTAFLRQRPEGYESEAQHVFSLAMMDVEEHTAENSEWFQYMTAPDIKGGLTIWALLDYRPAPGAPTAMELVYDELKAKYAEVHREMLQLVANSPMRLVRVTAFDSSTDEMEVEYVDDGADGIPFPVPNVFGVEPGDLVALRFFGLYEGKANFGQEFLRFPAEKADVVLAEYSKRHRDQSAALCFYRSYFRHVWERPDMKRYTTDLHLDDPDNVVIQEVPD